MSRHKSNSALIKEAELIQRAQKDKQYFGVLYEQYFEDVYLFVYRRTMAKELAADITSQVFYKALTHLNSFKFKGFPFSAWLFRIASNEVNMYYRKTKRKRHVALETSGAIRLCEEVEELSDEEPLQHLAAILNQLKPKEVTLLELRFFEERSFREISCILGVTENNAKVKMHRLLSKLRKILKAKLSNA